MTLDQNTEDDASADAIEAFASTCERLNDFARELREKSGFGDVRTGADIREYKHGWRLEKYVEADVDSQKGQVAAWWIEMGRLGTGWLVSSSVSISHTDIHVELPERNAKNSSELRSALRSAVDELVRMGYGENSFAESVRGIQK